MTRSESTFSCVVVRQSSGCTALCLDLDVASEEKTPAKAKRMLREAVELYLDSTFENNLPCMRPVPQDQDPRRTDSASITEEFTLGGAWSPCT